MSTASEVRCPHCGAEVLPDDYACPSCRRVIPWKKDDDSAPERKGWPANR